MAQDIGGAVRTPVLGWPVSPSQTPYDLGRPESDRATVKQLVILSGKGGTGKTAVAAAFAHLAHHDVTSPEPVVVDADVDAANLELLVGHSRVEEHEFVGMPIASIDSDRCIGCGICAEVCRFDAIALSGEGGGFRVDPLACEGCGTCFYQCPEEAIQFVQRVAGHWFRSVSSYGSPLFHARLRPAQENSGKLVALVKQRAREAAAEGHHSLMIVDGPPGIACPGHCVLSRVLICLTRGRANGRGCSRPGTGPSDDSPLSPEVSGLYQQGRPLSRECSDDRELL